MKHHNKHFMGAFSVIVLVMILTGVLLSTHNLHGFDVTGMVIYEPVKYNLTVTNGYETMISAAKGYFTNDKYAYPIFQTPVTINGHNGMSRTGQVFVIDNDNNVVASYNLVLAGDGKGNNKYYLALNDKTESENTYFYDFDAVGYTVTEEGGYSIIDITAQSSDYLTDEILDLMILSEKKNIIAVFDSILVNQKIVTRQQYDNIQKDIALDKFAKELGYTDKTAISNEEDAVNRYLSDPKSKYSNMKYDITTDTFSGQINDKTTISWDSKGDTMYVESGDTKIYVVEQKGKDVYYQQTKENGQWTDGKPIADTKQKADAAATYKAAEKQYDQLKEDKESAMKNGLITDKEGTAIKTSVREQAYLNKIYNELEAQFVGKVTGYLSKVIDNWLGLEGWSRGVPAGICKNIFGLEYYRNSGWISVPGNSSSSQLQSMLISHSNTIIIEGEKQEITETMYRYAYTIKLLANQSVEWKTYLYNSCSQENSEEQFYDYGALGAGEYYSFHYAGDTTFDCSAGQCLYDQACVALSDGSSPVCVSLTNGEGFETPQAGSDYDCAIT